jgi:hypothetical protein
VANIIIPGKWTRQPTYPTKVRNEVADYFSLVTQVLGGILINAVTGKVLISIGTTASQYGISINESGKYISSTEIVDINASNFCGITVGHYQSTRAYPFALQHSSSPTSRLYVYHFHDTGSIETSYVNGTSISGVVDTLPTRFKAVATKVAGVNASRFINGMADGTATITTSASIPNRLYLPTDNDGAFDSSYVLGLFSSKDVPDDLIKDITKEPWNIFVPLPKVLYFSVAGAVTHPSTGALTAQDAVVAGTAAHIALHPSTGALAADSAVVAGTAARIANHQSTGALSAGDAVVDGTAVNTPVGTVSHPSTGALTADSAIVAGTAAHIVNHQTTGALLADSAVVDGASVHIGTGAPTNLTGTPTNSTINWTWDSVATATGYEIEFGLDGGGYTVVDVGNTLTYEQTGLNENTLYEARVRAYYDVTGYLLLESNDRLLLESGDGLLQEAA